MAVWKYVGKKIFAALLTFLFVIAMNFFLFRMLPGVTRTLFRKTGYVPPDGP